MEDKITSEKIEKYFMLTSKALEKARENVMKKKEKDAKEIIDMVSNYLSDAEHFREKGDFVNAFAAINYAHGWLDSGVRLGIFDVDDSNLFTVK
jgi:uncharacterized protein